MIDLARKLAVAYGGFNASCQNLINPLWCFLDFELFSVTDPIWSEKEKFMPMMMPSYSIIHGLWSEGLVLCLCVLGGWPTSHLWHVCSGREVFEDF